MGFLSKFDPDEDNLDPWKGDPELGAEPLVAEVLCVMEEKLGGPADVDDLRRLANELLGLTPPDMENW